MEDLLSNPKLSYMASEFDTHFKVFHELMSNKVLEILLVASSYDAYILEEDGSLASKIINEYRGLNLSRPPRLTRVDRARRALRMLQESHFDLVITMPHLDDMDSFELGLAVKALKPDLPVILLAHSVQGLHPLPANKDVSGIDQIFIWSGDADLLLAIVKSVEDRLNVENDTQRAQVRVIILVEDSPIYRSYFLPLMYKEVVKQTQAVLEESLNEEHRLLKMRARPKILVAETYEAALTLYERYKPFLFGIFSDTRFPLKGRVCAEAGIRLLRRVKDEIPDLPLLLLSSEPHNRKKAEQIPSSFLDKNSPQLFDELQEFFLKQLGFGDFVFRLPDGTEVGRAGNLQQLEEILPTIPDEPLCYHALRNRFSNWIMARSEIVLASRLRQVQVSDFPSIESMRQHLIASIHGLRKWRQKGVVVQFNPNSFDPRIADFVKIGRGSLGGKARGLAFVANLLRQSPAVFDKYKEIEICIPQTLVITTSGFDAFLSANNLHELERRKLDDDRIAAAFLNGRMPPEILDDLDAFLKEVRHPLAVRSSSLLEDAHHQPLAGLYKSFMLANNHPDESVRLQQVVTAIKMVYASTWFALPQRYSLSSAFSHRREQMAVMIQQIVGKAYSNNFYPVLSGIARSQNYYPIDPIRPDDGMAQIALGFASMADQHRAGLRFCPKYPQILPDFSKIEDILANAQQHFFSLRLDQDGINPAGSGYEQTTLYRRNVSDALQEPPVQTLVSTYIPQDHRIRDSAVLPGPKVLTFASVLKYNLIPLAAVLDDLLKVGRQGMGYHIEFEFAVNLADEAKYPAQLYLLQMRPLSVEGDPFEFEVSEQDRQQAICYSTDSMGHGKYENMADIIYVRPDTFDAARTLAMAEQIGRWNAQMRDQRRPYLLIGPGRWGSFDRWLGIPVKWEDINGAGAIIELRDARLKADPSKGSHFFQHITSHGLAYLTISENGADTIRWERIQALPLVQETDFLRHVRLPEPLVIKCDGRSSQGVMLVGRSGIRHW
jgi:hypothetical protein